MNIYFLISLTSILSFGTICSQSNVSKTGTAYTSLNKKNEKVTPITTLKWTWQLPAAIKNSFYTSPYATWYIEKMISYNSGGKTVYRFYVNNGNLLDGDHHDNFLKTDSLDITDNGAVVRN
jgi:hypothetical protein